MSDSTKHGRRGIQGEEVDEDPVPPAITHEKPRGMWEAINALAVQRSATGATTSDEAPDAIARAGTNGASVTLPHREQIQASFGRHDVSGVQAHMGTEADRGSQALGARAYAVGDRVAFAGGMPDLHTAAHEAAHVVQQRGGVQLKGGIDGGWNDPWEQHANAVADRVVRGESAEGLLDTKIAHLPPESAAPTFTASPVQRKAAGAPAEGNVDDVARAGTACASSGLPHLDRIQASFGRHDVSGIRSHVGGTAAASSAALGAQAYAHGDAVGFESPPDLHTAAHEAAHVVQQRGGVQLKGGIDGGANDPYERHADEVADKVVRGESAEATLDVRAGSGRTNPGRAVQRRTGQASALQPPTWDYCNTYATKILVAISDRIRAVGLPKLHPRLYWNDREAAVQAVIAALWKDVQLFSHTTLHRLMEHSYPANLYALVDEARGGPEPGQWREEVGVAIAIAFSEPIDASVQRMGIRLRVQLDGPAHGIPHDVRGLVPSCTLDNIIADVLTQPGIVGGGQLKQTSVDDTPGKAFLKGAEPVSFNFAGKRDPKLWNWIEVTRPKSATVEDVASTELVPSKTDTAMGPTQAYRIAASPPFFGLPIEVARQIDEMRHFATGAELVDADSDDFGRVADASTLHKSAASDEAAIAQATPADLKAPSLDRLLGRVEVQLGVVQSKLARVGASNLVAGAPEFVARRRDDLAKDPKGAARWVAAVAGQEGVLHAVSSELVDVFDQLDRHKTKPASDQPQMIPIAVSDLIRSYAHAAGVSHLAAEANPALADARRQRALLPLSLIDEQVGGARNAIVGQRDASAGAAGAEKGADANVAAVPTTMTHIADLRLQAMRGEKLDGAEVEQVNTDAAELEMRARLATLATTVRQVKTKADEVGVSNDRSPDGSWSVQMIVDMILDLVYSPEKPYSQFEGAGKLHGGWIHRLDDAREYGTEPGAGHPMSHWMKPALGYIDGEMQLMDEQLGKLKEFIKWANGQVAYQKVKNLINSMALQIGLMIVTGEVAGAALSAIRGIALAGEIANDVRGAGLLWKGAEVAAHAGMQTVASGAVGGEISGRAFAENALGMLLTSAAMKPFQGLLHGSEAVEQEIRTFGQLAKHGAKLGAEVAIGAGSGVIASGLAHAVVNNTELGIASRDEWTSQGLAFAASAFVGQRTHAMHGRIAEAAHRFKSQTLERLAERADSLAKRADANKRPSRDEAAAMLAERHDLLLAEKTAYDGLGKDARDDAKRNTDDLAATGAGFADVHLQLAGLSPVVDGVSYEGTHADIQKALKRAAEQGIDLKPHQDEKSGIWTARAGEREISIKELDFKPGATNEAHAGHSERIVLAGTDEALASISNVVAPLPNTVDVFVHGTVDDLVVRLNDKEVHIDHRALATYIQKSNRHVEKVRLLACKAGQHPKGVAQHLANKLGVPVSAPSDTLWIREDGALIIGRRGDRNTGKWLEFEPTKSSSRYSTVPEPTQPERAIDRYHQQAPRQQTRQETREVEEPVSERDQVVEQQRAELDRASVKLGPKDAQPIEKVEGFAWDSELQMSSGIEIGDPLFGKSISKAISDALGPPEHRTEVLHLQSQLRANQHQLLEALRDPTLSKEKRQAELRGVVDEVGRAFAAHKNVFKGLDTTARVERARKAIQDTVDESFDLKMTLDDRGTVHRGREQLGTFRNLVDQVVAANRALTKSSIAAEFVISVSETRSSTLREVLVLQRARQVTSRSRSGDQLPVQKDVDPNAVIVDIGSGKSSFGIDLLQAKDRGGGPLVQTEHGPSILDGSRTRSDLTWEGAVPRTDDNSAVIFGDPLQTMDLMFGEHGVKRVFINNVNAGYEASDYTKAAKVLAKSMTVNGRVEVQWNEEAARHHIKGPELEAALNATGRAFAVDKEQPETKFKYSVKPSTRKDGPDGSKEIPDDPIPTARWIFTFQ